MADSGPATISRQRTRTARVGDIAIGGGAPIVVQSMTNTDTADIAATVAQVEALATAGSELVRITVNNEEAAAAVAPIRLQLDAHGCAVPLIGDFHFNGHKLLTEYPECAQALAKYRVNPGNVGKGSKHDAQFAIMIEHAVKWGKPIRIGVNWGSLDQELLLRLMDENSLAPEPKSAQEVMREAIDAPGEMSPQAPRIITIKVPVDKIGEVIGPKGKMINSIQDDTGAEITIEDDGTIYVGATDGASAEAARAAINAIANPHMPEVGERFLGTVVKTTTFGAFVSLLPGKDGLLHITQIRKLHGGRRIENIDDVIHIGDKIQVEIREIDDRGKLSLVPVEVVEREAAGEDLSGGEAPRDRGDRPRTGDRPGDRGDRGGGDRSAGDRSGDGPDGHRRTRHRTRGHHE